MNNSNTVWILSQVRRVISVFVLLAAVTAEIPLKGDTPPAFFKATIE